MNWLYSSKQWPSTLNGDITVTRRLGAWTVEVNGTYQTSSYTNDMWREAVRQASDARNGKPIEHALLIGLGGGGAVGAIGKRFPAAEVAVIEHDPAMVAITKETGLYKPGRFPDVMVADAGSAMANLKEQYDLIIVDIFSGKELAPEISDESFWRTLKAHMAPGGIISVNVSGHRSAIETVANAFSHGSIWMFRYNTLGTFWE